MNGFARSVALLEANQPPRSVAAMNEIELLASIAEAVAAAESLRDKVGDYPESAISDFAGFPI